MTVNPIEAAVLIFLSVLSLAISAQAGEIQNFRVEWCSVNRFREATDVDQVCFGRASFLGNLDMRAVGVRTFDGRNEVYVEGDIPKVELFELSFDVVGPINRSLAAEFGFVRLSIDEDGEVNAVHGRTPRHGRFGAFRDSRDRSP